MSLRLLAFSLFLALAGPAVLAPAVLAQPDDEAAEHVLEIRDGHVFLDGEMLSRRQLPAGLDLGGLELTYQFAGPVVPVLEIDGVVYVLEQKHLRVLAETDRAREQVYFLPETEGAAPSGDREGAAEGSAAQLASPTVGRSAREAPSADEAYFEQVRTQDRPLFDQIQREQNLEAETIRLATRIRNASSGDERARLTGELRAMLGESFDLKQNIRADEITKAEEQIRELRRLLDERAQRKPQIIERRIEELTGGR